MPDVIANFVVSTVATAPSPATTGTSLVVASGEGARFPDPATYGPYNVVVWPTAVLPDPDNAEIVRVTARSTDTLTITREQEGSTARTVVVGDSVALAITKKTVDDILLGARVPSSPDSLDDEFNGVLDTSTKWTTVNNPASGDALNTTDYPGHLHVGLLELGTDDFANAVRLYQTPPTGAQTMEFVAKVSLAVVEEGWQASSGQFCGVGVYLGNLANSQFVSASIRFNDSAGPRALRNDNMVDNGAGGFTTAGSDQGYEALTPGGFIWLKLVKTEANAYTSSNIYRMYISGDGLIWHNTGQQTKTFSADCDEVGLLFRRPSSQAGTPKGEALVDCFRRTG